MQKSALPRRSPDCGQARGRWQNRPGFAEDRGVSPDTDILIREGEVIRFIMINRTMMHHPMHLHGHFFRVINGQGARSPLKHTVNVAPMTTTVIEFMADEPGDWFFHCHLLYHMMSGMARVVEHQGFTPAPETAEIRDEIYAKLIFFPGISIPRHGSTTMAKPGSFWNANSC